MNEAPANALGLAEPNPPGEGWSRNRWLTILTLVFAAHIALICMFGEWKPVVPRAVTNAPALGLADDADELLALNDPTLFALPHQRDFVTAAWLKLHDPKPPSFRWTEPPRWLALSAASLGATFHRLMQTNVFAGSPLDFKPPLTLSTPVPPLAPMLPQQSTLRIEGELAQRQLPTAISLTNWPLADVLPPSVVQVLVNPAGNVVSSVVLTPSGYDEADQRAAAIARTLRFKPAASVTLGRIIFHWHTVPPAPVITVPTEPATNEYE